MTEIQRIPGTFNLSNEWPKVQFIDLYTDVLSTYQAGDVLGDMLSPVTYWPSRTAQLDLVESSPSKPIFRNEGDVTPAGKPVVEFAKANGNYLRSTNMAPYNGPLTIALVGRWISAGDGATDEKFVSTGPNGYHIAINPSSGNIVARTPSTTGGFNQVFMPMPETVYSVIVAVFDGANSSISVNGITTTGSLDYSIAAVDAITFGANSSGTQNLNGRIAELTVWTKALNSAGVQGLTRDLRTKYGV